jgi:uncharacterized membrane protein
MHFPDDLFPAAWQWLGWMLALAGLGWAMRGAPWRRYAESDRTHLFLGATVAVAVLWQIKAGVRPGLDLHVSGLPLLTLMFGPHLALIAGALALLLFTALVAGGWEAWGLSWLVMVAVPVAVSHWLLQLCQRRLPTHFFIYVFVNAFLGGGLAIAALGIVATLLLAVSGAYEWSYLREHYLLYYVLMAWAEAMTTGMLMTVLIVYQPRWVESFDDARYIRDK